MLTIGAVAICYFLNLWLVPLSYAAFREYQFEIRNRMAAFLLQEGVFTPISDDMTVYVRSRDRDGTLRGILVEDARQKTSRATILAETGRLVEGPAGPRVVLHNGSREEIDRTNGRLNVLSFAENTIDLASGNKNGEQRFRDAAEMSTQELLDPPPSTQARDIGKLKVEGHRRLATPLTAASFAMVALLSVLAGTFHGTGTSCARSLPCLAWSACWRWGWRSPTWRRDRPVSSRSSICMPYCRAFCAWRLFAGEIFSPRPADPCRPERRRFMLELLLAAVLMTATCRRRVPAAFAAPPGWRCPAAGAGRAGARFPPRGGGDHPHPARRRRTGAFPPGGNLSATMIRDQGDARALLETKLREWPSRPRCGSARSSTP